MRAINMSLTAKIFTAIAGTVSVVILALAAMVAFNMRDGFAQYLLRVELQSLTALQETLSDMHSDAEPGWPQLTAAPLAWQQLVAQHLKRHAPPPGARPAPPGSRRAPPGPPRGLPPPHLRHFAPMQIQDRVGLLNAAGQQIAGHNTNPHHSVKRAIFAPGALETDTPVGWIRLAAPLGAPGPSDRAFLYNQLKFLAISVFLALGVSALAAFVLARQFLAPIRTLEAGAKTLASGDYAARMPQERQDELGGLIGHFNALAANLEASELAERQWVSDTSHELQTPLTVLRAQIEAVQDGVRKADAATLQDMHHAVMRLSRLVEDLRVLSHGREIGMEREGRSVDLSQIVQDAYDAHADRFDSAGLEIALNSWGELPVTGDPQRLRQVVDNLLENSLRYSAGPGYVELTTYLSGGQATFLIEDSPPAPPPGSLDQLFDRFYRAEASRSRAHGGSGLGLAICKTIVEVHGGKITAQTSRYGGLGVVISLPLERKNHV